jgi:BirA family biotin operon repressor/biotin-[acetyl-CoA-carboxylase] ligase
MVDYPAVNYAPDAMDSQELLDHECIHSGLSPQARALLSELVLHRDIDSTNADVARRLEAGAGSGLVVSAEQQTAGRGRHGRRWVSPFGTNIYLSLAWRFAQGVDGMVGLSLAAGAAAADALEQHGLADICLKWPNDILYGGAKLGGILVETSGAAAGPVTAVVGIGINLRMPAESAETIDQAWTDAERATGATIGRNALLASLLNHMLPLLAGYEDEGFGSWRERWQDRNAHIGQPVTVRSGDSSVVGIVSGIDQTGALLLDVGGTEQVFSGGEVSLRADG